MDIIRSYTFITEDSDWIGKTAIGGLVALISPLLLGLPVLLLYGYEIAVTRSMLEGRETPLPNWDDWGALFRDGLFIALARLVYTAPIWIVLCIGFFLTVVPLSATSGSGDAATAMGGIAAVTWTLLSCLIILMALLLALIGPAINLQYVRYGEFAACFRVGEVLGMVRDHIGDFLMIAVGLILANLLIGLIGTVSIITICGPFFISLAGMFLIRLVSGHLVGQLGRKLAGKEPEAVAPDL